MMNEKQQKVRTFIEHTLEKGISQQAFDRLAEYLLHKCHLRLDDGIYYLTEIEFYCHEKEEKKDAWRDDFIYAKKYEADSRRQRDWEKAVKFQSQACLFFPHYAGIDFTFGNSKRYGGILLRGIVSKERQNEDIQLQNRPSKVLTKLTQSHTKCMEESATERSGIIFQGPRVNITTDYRPLRYAVDLNRPQKQTLLLSSMLLGILDDKGDNLKELMGEYSFWWNTYQVIKTQK